MITQAAAIKALADGKIIRNERAEYMLEWGELKYRFFGESEWTRANSFGGMIDITERYPLTFDEAYKKMRLDGCKVSRKGDPSYCFLIEMNHDVAIIYKKRLDNGVVKAVFFGPTEMDDTWRVVD